MDTYTFHPAADHFPMHTPEEFDELLHSVRHAGFDATHPIVLCEGQILDGRNRYKACQILGIVPTYVHYTGNPYEKSWRENGSRRDLTPGQKAAIRLQINQASATWQEEEAQRRTTANSQRSLAAQERPRDKTGLFLPSSVVQECTTLDTTGRTPTQHAKTRLAKDAGVSPRTAAAALALATKAPALLQDVAHGTISLQDATNAANRAVIKAKVGDTWTPFERKRRHWVEDLGYPTLANYHRDPHLLEWARETGRHVFIGRSSIWGNPFELGKDGDRQYVIDSFALYYYPRKLSLHPLLPQLQGKVLECYCVPERCHGELYIETLCREAWELLDGYLIVKEDRLWN